MTSQPCWTCQKYYGGCSWTARDPATGQLQFKPVEGWEAVHRVYGEYQRYGIKAVESYEIISCPEYVSDGSDSRRSRFPRGWEKELDDLDERSI